MFLHVANNEPVGKDTENPLLSALGEVLETTRTAQAALQESELRTMGNIARIQAGEPLTEIVRESPVSMARNELNDAFDRLTAVRQASRAATFRQLAEEGMTRKEIASKWGFSQQVVSRVVNHDHGSIKRGQGPEVPA